MHASWTPNNPDQKPLEKFARNLTKMAQQNKLDPVINRDDEIRRIIRILSRKNKNNPILVGEPGVGKTAIIEGLAKKIVEGDVPETLKGKEVFEIDLPALIAGASYQGQFEERIKNLIKEIEESQGQYIVFIDEIHTLVGTGRNAGSAMDAANIIKPVLARGDVKLIGATTFDEYKKYIESDPALERRMQKINVLEPTVDDAITILRGIKERYESFHKIKITDSAIVAAVKLSSIYITDRFLPDKAIDLIDEASATLKTELNYQPEELDKIQQEISYLKTELAAKQAEKNEEAQNRIIYIENNIVDLEEKAKQIKDQWNAKKDLIDQISATKNKINDLKHDAVQFQSEGKFKEASEILYLTLPSVEKELAKLEEIANKSNYLKDEIDEEQIAAIVAKWTGIPIKKLVETERQKILNLNTNLKKKVIGQDHAIDSVYKSILRSKANINNQERVIGSFIFMGPTGVGKTELSRALADSLFNSSKEIIRLDMSEYMEKHSISKIIGSPPGYVGFEQGGQLTEKVRRKPYSIILFDEIEKAHPDIANILLQILDNGELRDSQGKLVNFRNTIIIMTTNLGSQEILKNKKLSDQQARDILLKFFRPEFINRIDGIIVFNKLSKENVHEIAKNELDKMIHRVKNNKGIEISYDNRVLDYIVKEAYDPEYGARPINRFIQMEIENPIAYKIIDENLGSKDKIYIDIDSSKKQITIS